MARGQSELSQRALRHGRLIGSCAMGITNMQLIQESDTTTHNAKMSAKAIEEFLMELRDELKTRVD